MSASRSLNTTTTTTSSSSSSRRCHSSSQVCYSCLPCQEALPKHDAGMAITMPIRKEGFLAQSSDLMKVEISDTSGIDCASW